MVLSIALLSFKIRLENTKYNVVLPGNRRVLFYNFFSVMKLLPHPPSEFRKRISTKFRRAFCYKIYVGADFYCIRHTILKNYIFVNLQLCVRPNKLNYTWLSGVFFQSSIKAIQSIRQRKYLFCRTYNPVRLGIVYIET
jgi:hypothetical protein